jgi:Holliday junction resolvasome RuvABC ATP-dependent DNA helicase subunit
MWKDFLKHSKISDGWMTPLHEKYLNILREANRPLGLKSIAIQLWMTEKWVEEDIEPLLLKMWKIDKTTQGRILVWEHWYGLFS